MWLGVCAIAAGPFFVPGASAEAQSPCKGLQQSACDADASCSWVKSFVTKAGRQVDAYCRKKPVRKASAAKAVSDRAEEEASR